MSARTPDMLHKGGRDRARRDLAEQAGMCEVTCRVPECHVPATRIVTFGDGQTARACVGCATYLEQLAIQEHKTSIGVRRI